MRHVCHALGHLRNAGVCGLVLVGDTRGIRPLRLLLPLVVLAAAAAPAHGAQITVNTTADQPPAVNDGACSLREAITSANSDNSPNGECIDGSGPDEIVFDLALPATIAMLPGFSYTVSSNVTINGPAGAGLTIDGGNATRPFVVSAAANLTLDRLTIANGKTSLAGGAIQSQGVLTIRNSTLRDSAADVSGGAIASQAGSVTVENSTISGNTATIAGGGINAFATLVLRRSTIAGNSAPAGAGLREFGTTTIESSVLADNTLSPDCEGTGVIASNSLIENSACPVVGSDVISGQDPMLGPLQSNGGPTATHLPGSGSPLIDRGVNVGGVASDQRGGGFPRTADLADVANGPGSDGTDIGAVEVQPAVAPSPGPAVPMPTGSAAPAPTAGDPVCATVPERRSSRKGTIRYTRQALQIQQAIDAEVLRRLNGLNAWIDAGVQLTDLCAGAFGPAAFGAGIGFAGGGAYTPTPPTPRSIETVKRDKQPGTIERSRRQLVINGNIGRALRARAVATLARVNALTGGNLAPGVVLSGRALWPGLLASTPLSPVPDAPATPLEIGRLPKRIPVRENAGTVRKQQRRSQTSIILANRAIDVARRGLTEENFVPGSIGTSHL